MCKCASKGTSKSREQYQCRRLESRCRKRRIAGDSRDNEVGAVDE